MRANEPERLACKTREGARPFHRLQVRDNPLREWLTARTAGCNLGNCSDLLHHAHLIPHRPFLGDHAVDHPGNRDTTD